MTADFNVIDHGSIAVLTPVSAEATTWCDDHLPDDAPRWGSGYVIESNYLPPILEGIAEEGLTLG